MVAKIAFEVSPPDTVVKTTAEETVVGRIASKQKPNVSSGSKTNLSGKSKKTMSAGNRAKFQLRTNTCNRLGLYPILNSLVGSDRP